METAQLVLRGAGGLLAVLGTLWVCVRVAKARGGAAGAVPAVRLRVLARASLGRHASMVSVDVGDRILVVGVGEHGVRLLAEQPAPVLPVSAEEYVEFGLDGRPLDPAAAVGPGATGVPAPRSALAGSLVDRATWRAVVSAARDRTVRR